MSAPGVFAGREAAAWLYRLNAFVGGAAVGGGKTGLRGALPQGGVCGLAVGLACAIRVILSWSGAGRPPKPRDRGTREAMIRKAISGLVPPGASSPGPYAPALLVALLAVALPLVPADIASPRWHGMKTLVFEVGAALVLALWPLSRASAQGGRLGRGAPMLLALLVLWAWLSHALTPADSPDHAFSFQGWWLLAGGLAVTAAAAAAARQRAGLALLLGSLCAAALVIGGSAVALYLQAGMPVAEGTFHDHMLLGAALMILLPMTLAAAVSPGSQAGRTLAMAALVTDAAGLLLSQARSAWIGAAVALLAFGALSLWCRRRAPRRRGADGPRGGRGQALVYGLLLAVALGGFVLYAQQDGALADRARTLTTSVLQGREGSVEWRLSTWRGALRMVRRRPLLGWGVGCYPPHQRPFTGAGEPPAVVARDGPRIWDEAHNSYLQTAAEMGAPGLVLWLSVLGAALIGGAKALGRLPEGGAHQRALVGALSALAGQAVDAVASPGWQFGEVAVYLWMALGLAAGLTGEAEGSEARASGGNGRPWVRPLQAVAALLVCAWVISEAVRHARLLPTPHL